MVREHATCIDVDGTGVLLWGASGSGKSDLALRLIDGGARLVADDYTELEARDGKLVAHAPETIKGAFEVRGLGILRLESDDSCAVGLAVSLVRPDKVERTPEPAEAHWEGIAVPLIHLAPFEASAPAKVRMAVRTVTEGLLIR